MIRLQGISRSFEVGGEPVHALVDVDETIGSGEHLAIMGPSGSGKSTLLHILGCLDRPDRGVYQLLGRDVARLDEAELSLVRRHTIGFVFQFFHLVPRLTALENVELPMIFAGIEKGERRERAMGRLRAVGLEPRASHRPDQLSGGERQRAAIARATVLDPKLLLADEPTGNLDTSSGRHVLEILEQMNAAGLTLVVVTHDPAVARRARRVLVLKDGRIVHRGDGTRIHDAVEVLAAAEDGG
ncbi:MAG TPA: ABC transporter ATP-binding protein [Anaeromyxobacteraceae bacterium]|nr:ABC transporter ATP-binding protein [Anaeromyxobacteraceae bacterium]